MACSVWPSTRRKHSISSIHGSKDMKTIHDGKDVVTIQSSSSHDHDSALLGRSNLDCFLDHITPSVTVSCPPKGMVEESILRQHQYNEQSMCAFTLDELWRCYDEWSVYGAGVPLALPCVSETIMQYYVPYLSAMQIYLHPGFTKRRSGDESDWSDTSDTRSVSDFGSGSDNENEKMSRFHMKCDQWDSLSSFSSDRLSSNSSEQLGDRHGDLIFEYFEQCSPYGRTPLAGKIRELAIDFPQLYTLRSNELSPASWVSVAWYPIYRIPTGPTMSHLSTCFLTFHTLWIPPSSQQDAQNDCGMRKNSLVVGFENNSDTCSIKPDPSIGKQEQEPWLHDHASWRIKAGKVVELPPFGLVSYKLGGPFWALAQATDKRRMTSLANCADSWLRQLKVQHPDFDFFASREGIKSNR